MSLFIFLTCLALFYFSHLPPVSHIVLYVSSVVLNGIGSNARLAQFSQLRGMGHSPFT